MPPRTALAGLVLGLALGLALLTPAESHARQPGTPEEQLAEKYAPILYLREQRDRCGQEAYRPMPVEVVLQNPSVLLVTRDQEGRSARPQPGSAGLFDVREDASAYIDLPGSPNRAGCTYPSDFRRFGEGAPPVTYAHIAREKGFLALQYWFYYYFNDWNNQHESDWEMIQVLFRADSAAEALTQAPLRVSFARHSGGETAAWNDPKLRREGDHPVVFVSAGSHASYFEPRVYLGLGEQGAGLGCDDASGDARRVPLEPRLVPATTQGEDDPYAWSSFQGRWGERAPGQNNGPRGPNATKRWTQPVTHFDDDIPDYDITVPHGATLGPNAIGIFCDIVSLSGLGLSLYYQSPWTVGLVGGVLVLAAAAFLVGMTRETFFVSLTGAPAGAGQMGPRGARGAIGAPSAVGLYGRHPWVFLGIGAIFIPISIGTSLLTNDGEITIGDLALGLPLLGGLPLFTAFVVVGPAVAAVLRRIGAGDRPRVLDGYQVVWRHLGTLSWARLKVMAIVSLLVLTVIGIPFAVERMVRWIFVEQAIVLDGADSRTALPVSARAVRGRWWRTAATAVLLLIAGLLTGPVVAIAALFVVHVSADAANVISSIVYALLLPLIFIALTQFYEGLQVHHRAAVAARGTPSDGSASSQGAAPQRGA